MFTVLHDDHAEALDDEGVPPLGAPPWAAELKHVVVGGDWYVHATCTRCGLVHEDFAGVLGDAVGWDDWLTHGTRHQA